ncbi:CTP synthetase [Pseudooceanicola onchidii]|uniref:CTP synthetase n=1 Tax=Pseudooceanicola onchidii TaxID=2562279 RepID=UPI0010AB42C7|nr:CTP synthetase [Pseudooceanicola onchidii]
MLRLASMLYSLIGTTLAGSAVVVALVTGQDTLRPILMAAVFGAVAAVPVTWAVARRLYDA